MRNVIVFLISFVVVSCGVAQSNTPPDDDPQLAAITEEIESWKKEMLRNTASRGSIETLLRQGVAFQKDYNAETDSIVRGGLIEDYLKQRETSMKKLPVTVFMTYGRDLLNNYPTVLVFDRDDLELDAKRPFMLNLNRKVIINGDSSKRHMLFSYKESQRFANLLSSFIGKARVKDLTSVSARDCVVSVQMAGEEAAIFMQLKTPTGTLSPELYWFTAFDARLLIERIQTSLTASPPPDSYREPDDLDPATILFATPSGETGGSKPNTPQQPGAAGAIPTGSLSFDVSRMKVSQGRVVYGSTRIQQQFDYRAMFRWSGTQPLNLQVVMFLLASPNNKLSIVGRDAREVTVEPGRAQELLMSAEQVIPGPTAGAVVVQCFSGGRLMKSYASSSQYKKYAEMQDIESQLPPLYQNPPTYYLLPTR